MRKELKTNPTSSAAQHHQQNAEKDQQQQQQEDDDHDNDDDIKMSVEGFNHEGWVVLRRSIKDLPKEMVELDNEHKIQKNRLSLQKQELLRQVYTFDCLIACCELSRYLIQDFYQQQIAHAKSNANAQREQEQQLVKLVWIFGRSGSSGGGGGGRSSKKDEIHGWARLVHNVLLQTIPGSHNTTTNKNHNSNDSNNKAAAAAATFHEHLAKHGLRYQESLEYGDMVVTFKLALLSEEGDGDDQELL